MKVWLKSVIGTIIIILADILLQIIIVKKIDWIEVLITVIIFIILDLIYCIIRNKFSKK